MSTEKKQKLDEIHVGNEVFVPMISEEQLQKRLAELGKQISDDYQGKLPIFIGVLNGSFLFMADLVKNVTVNCEIDFMKLSSYGEEKISSGKVKMLKELNADINDRHIIIVEDIVDTGLSISYIEKLLEPYTPASVKVCSLLLKPESLKYQVKIEKPKTNLK